MIVCTYVHRRLSLKPTVKELLLELLLTARQVHLLIHNSAFTRGVVGGEFCLGCSWIERIAWLFFVNLFLPSTRNCRGKEAGDNPNLREDALKVSRVKGPHASVHSVMCLWKNIVIVVVVVLTRSPSPSPPLSLCAWVCMCVCMNPTTWL